jgi:hypothetical protein
VVAVQAAGEYSSPDGTQTIEFLGVSAERQVYKTAKPYVQNVIYGRAIK